MAISPAFGSLVLCHESYIVVPSPESPFVVYRGLRDQRLMDRVRRAGNVEIMALDFLEET